MGGATTTSPFYFLKSIFWRTSSPNFSTNSRLPLDFQLAPTKKRRLPCSLIDIECDTTASVPTSSQLSCACPFLKQKRRFFTLGISVSVDVLPGMTSGRGIVVGIETMSFCRNRRLFSLNWLMASPKKVMTSLACLVKWVNNIYSWMGGLNSMLFSILDICSSWKSSLTSIFYSDIWLTSYDIASAY